MDLKKVVMLEIIIVVIVLAVVMTFVGIIPYLTSSQQSRSIGVYSERVYDEGNVTLIRGKTMQSAIFNYTTFDPAILVLDLNFQTWQAQGNLTISVNSIDLATITPTPEKPQVSLNAVSFSGQDLVTPYAVYSILSSNQIDFSSKIGEGYAGTFSYRISIRGSR
jgi:hypothetical protein